MSFANPFSELGRGRGDSWFQARDHRLIAAMKKAHDHDDEVAAMEATSHVHDKELLEALEGLGINHHTLPVLHLVPLAEVAWADGRLVQSEKEALLEAAAGAGLVPRTQAWEAFRDLLEAAPSPELAEAAHRYIWAVLASQPELDTGEALHDIEGALHRVARHTHVLLGRLGYEGRPERRVIERLTKELHALATRRG